MSSTVESRGERAPIYRIFIAALVYDLAIAVIGLGVQLLGNELGARPTVLGWLGTLGPLTYALGCMFSGRLSDRFGRRALVSLSCAVCGVAWLTMTQAGSALQLLAILPFSGAGISLFWPPLQAWMSEITVGGREQLNRNIGGFNIAWTIGLMLGPIVAGVAWDFGRAVPFIIAAACAGGILMLVQTIPKQLPGGGEPAPDEDAFEGRDGRVVARFLHLAWIANFASWFGRGLNIVVFTKIATEMEMSASTIGITVAMFLAGQLLMFLYLRNRPGWQYRLWPLIASLLGAGGAWLIAWQAQSAWLFGLAFALAGMGAGVTYVSSLYYSLQGRTVSRGARAGIHEAVLGSGVFLGPLLGGVVAEHLGLRAPYVMSAVLFAVVALIVYGAWRQMRNGIKRKAARKMEVSGE